MYFDMVVEASVPFMIGISKLMILVFFCKKAMEFLHKI